MGITFGAVIHKMIPHGDSSLDSTIPDAVKASPHFRFVYHKATKSFGYEVFGENNLPDMPFEKVCYKMNKQFQKFQTNLIGIKNEEKNELKALKDLFIKKRDEYKSRHSWLFLLFRGCWNGGHIDDLSEEFIAKIDHIIKKTPKTPDVTNLDTFLRLIVPPASYLLNSLEKMTPKWVFDPLTQVIMVKGFEIEAANPMPWIEEGLKGDLAEVLMEMNKQLDTFGAIESITNIQQNTLTALKLRLIDQIKSDKAEGDDLVSMRAAAVNAKIDLLLAKPISSVKVKTAEQMEVGSTHNINEIFTTERTFLKNITESINFLKRLDSAIKHKGIKYGPQYANFLNSVNKNNDPKVFKGNLKDCIKAFEDLANRTRTHLQMMGSALKNDDLENEKKRIEEFGFDAETSSQGIRDAELKDLENKKTAIARIYKDPEYVAYSKETSKCARYNNLLQAVKKDLEDSNIELNPNTGKPKLDYRHKPVLLKALSENIYDKKDPSDSLITVVQRQPRHGLLMLELLENTAQDHDSYNDVLEGYINANSCAALVNVRQKQKFIA